MTEIGKCLKYIRIAKGDSLRDMATKLNMSAAYLSAIENGKRNIPEDFFSIICAVYAFDDREKERLKSAILASTSNYKVDLTALGDKQRQVLLSLAEGEMDEEVVNKLCEVVNENKNKNKKF